MYEVNPLICPSSHQKKNPMRGGGVFNQNTLSQTPNSTPHPQSHVNQFGNFDFNACSHPVKPSANTLKEKIHYHKSQC